jgi:hypothetical protein
MRKGTNPNKEKTIKESDYFHQVVIPVYIPHFEGYYKDSFLVFQTCLTSLFTTSHSKTFITVVNNGSCSEIEIYLDALYQKGKIHELIQTSNIGKINAVFKGISGQNFPMITLSDADVLFLNDWQKETYLVFEGFPKAGVVCTTPNSRTLKQMTGTIYFDCFFSNKLQFKNVENPDGMSKFLESINNERFFRKIHFEKNLTVNTEKITAVVGAGHYVSTFRKEIFEENSRNAYESYLGGKAMKIIDSLVIKKGYWRLSTANNYTYHMGNTLEQWMHECLKKNTVEKNEFKVPKLSNNRPSIFLAWIKNNIFERLLFSKHIFWKNFLRFKGLKKEEAKLY